MKIAILGASKPHLPLYLKAKELGLETYCIAWAEGAFCKDYADHFHDISIIDKEAIVDLCIREGIKGIVSNALEPAVPTMAYVAEKCGFNGISYSTALTATNKVKMRRCIEKHRACPQPHFEILNESTYSIDTFPVIIKPSDSSCSNGVSKVTCQEELDVAIRNAFSASNQHEVLVEEYIEGKEISVESISFHNKHYILTITDKETTGAPHFVETAHHQPSQLNLDLQKKIKTYTNNILNAIGISNGAAHSEFKIDADGNVYFIEVGARGGGDFISYQLVELSTGYDYIKGMIEVALNQFTEPNINEGKKSGVYFLSKETSNIKSFIEENYKQPWMIDYHIENKPLIELTKSQDRIGYFIYQGDHKIIVNNQ